MTEVGNKLMKLKGSTEKDWIPLHEKFHRLEDEQISIDNLIRKLQDWLNPEENQDDFSYDKDVKHDNFL